MFIVYDNEHHAKDFVEFATSEKDYPKQGDQINGGVPFTTTQATFVIKHYNQDLWAVSLATIEDLKPVGMDPINLDESWFPPRN